MTSLIFEETCGPLRCAQAQMPKIVFRSVSEWTVEFVFLY
jgi:hypothetical protein